MRSETVAAGCHRLRIGLFERFSWVSHLPPDATGWARWAPKEAVLLGQPAAIQLDVLALTRLPARWSDSATPVGGSCLLDYSFV